jgi:hypothetical protein
MTPLLSERRGRRMVPLNLHLLRFSKFPELAWYKKTELRSSTRRNRRLGVQIMRGILFWLVGIPIPIIIPFYLFDVV